MLSHEDNFDRINLKCDKLQRKLSNIYRSYFQNFSETHTKQLIAFRFYDSLMIGSSIWRFILFEWFSVAAHCEMKHYRDDKYLKLSIDCQTENFVFNEHFVWKSGHKQVVSISKGHSFDFTWYQVSFVEGCVLWVLKVHRVIENHTAKHSFKLNKILARVTPHGDITHHTRIVKQQAIKLRMRFSFVYACTFTFSAKGRFCWIGYNTFALRSKPLVSVATNY